MPITSVYIAGPGVFFPDAIEHRDRKKALCKQYSFEGLSPLDYELKDTVEGPLKFSKDLFDANIQLMNQADAVIADLTPFRGSSADSGTIFEIGYMRSKDKPVLGYSNFTNDYQSRIEHNNLIDKNNHRVENFGLADNLMIVHGCDIFIKKATDQPYFNIDGFEECLIKLKNL